MQRRNFLKNSLLTSAALSAGTVSATDAFSTDSSAGKHRFKLKYAPHLGMFQHHAGNDPLDQLRFMADMGFRAFEDNGMMGRDVSLQEKNGQADGTAEHRDGRLRGGL